MKTLFSIDEAAKFLSANSPFTISSEDVVDLAKQERLPICFAIQGDIFPLKIEGDGETKEINTPFPFSGIVRSMSPPNYDDILVATMVEVVRVDAFRQTRAGNMEQITIKTKDHEWVAQRGSKVFGTALPTEQPYGGAIKAGYRVRGYINFTEIPLQNWRFEIGDLRQLLQPASAITTTPENQSDARLHRELVEKHQLASDQVISNLSEKEAPDTHRKRDERGCRKLILDNWASVVELHGTTADGRQVARVIRRNLDPDQKPPSLKTVRNRIIELRKEKLIP